MHRQNLAGTQLISGSCYLQKCWNYGRQQKQSFSFLQNRSGLSTIFPTFFNFYFKKKKSQILGIVFSYFSFSTDILMILCINKMWNSIGRNQSDEFFFFVGKQEIPFVFCKKSEYKKNANHDRESWIFIILFVKISIICIYNGLILGMYF